MNDRNFWELLFAVRAFELGATTKPVLQRINGRNRFTIDKEYCEEALNCSPKNYSLISPDDRAEEFHYSPVGKWLLQEKLNEDEDEDDYCCFWNYTWNTNLLRYINKLEKEGVICFKNYVLFLTSKGRELVEEKLRQIKCRKIRIVVEGLMEDTEMAAALLSNKKLSNTNIYGINKELYLIEANLSILQCKNTVQVAEEFYRKIVKEERTIFLYELLRNDLVICLPPEEIGFCLTDFGIMGQRAGQFLEEVTEILIKKYDVWVNYHQFEEERCSSYVRYAIAFRKK